MEEIEENGYKREREILGKYRPLITPHVMRHNFITMCWEHGIDEMVTMKLVGHADFKTTRNIYTHLSKKQMGKAKGLMDDMFEKEKVAQKLHSEKPKFEV